MKFIFLMDPLETIQFSKDTTFMLMLGAQHKGHTLYYVPKDGISLINGQVVFNATHVIAQAIEHQPFIIKDTVQLSGNDIHAVFIRPDPPFNDQYLTNTLLLEFLPKNIFIMNSPSGIRSVNEKIWASQFTSLVPPTLISCNQNELNTFITTHNDIIAKPTNSFGGQSIFHIQQGLTNNNVILETLTNFYSRHIILQKYVPEAKNGDKRILLLNGEYLGAVLRVHGKNEHRNNFYAGGKPEKATLNKRDTEIITALKPYLQKNGLFFVGIDVLGDYLIEVNVTSPTCLQEMNRLYNVNLETKVIEFVEGLCRN